ncbi:Hypothetical protein PHPALM_18575, partial [Phytophthora palmivora]
MPTTKFKTYPHHVRASLLRVAKDDGDCKAWKFLSVHIEYLLEELASTPELTLVQMAELDEQKFSVAITRETVRRALDARSFTVKKLYRDAVTRNSPTNSAEYVIKFYAALANVVVALDIAPYHTDAEDVFDEEEFEDAE